MITGNEPINATGIAKRTQLPASGQWIQEVDHYPGLTIRQHFAAMAAQGILAGADLSNQNGIYVNGGFIHPATVAKDAVQIADAMVEELNK